MAAGGSIERVEGTRGATVRSLRARRRSRAVRRERSTACRLPPAAYSSAGFTLIELVITMTVMAVLALGVIPMVKTAVRRQKEQQLREDLRMMRDAIKEFRRDSVGMQCNAGGLPAGGPVGEGGANVTPNPAGQPNQPGVPGQPATPGFVDPRSTVVIGDCTIFTVDNPDHYPPDLDTLVNGVNVVPRNASQAQLTGAVQGNFLDRQQNATVPKKKVYLREVPVDPITGKKDWVVCSSWESQDAETCSGKENVFDVRSASRDTALDGKEKYSEW
ncbi:MAG: type II secretion system GspH family protein [Acidobacteriota bacterium]|nr:type II secretion system GspH family protein [Acidobacteriota bacterium]